MSTIHKASPSGPKALSRVVVPWAGVSIFGSEAGVNFVIPGLKATDLVICSMSELIAGVSMSVATVDEDVVNVRFTNTTGSTKTVGNADMIFAVFSFS